MKKLIPILFFLGISLPVICQEKVVLDSIPKPDFEKTGLLTGQPLTFDNSLSMSKFGLLTPLTFDQPLLPDYNKILNLNKTFSGVKMSTQTDLSLRMGYLPFFSSGKILNQASYRLNDKFSFGGNSFGGQSVFDQPALNPAIQNMSTKGASMFMQYKVSKNFKIETRVTLTNHQ